MICDYATRYPETFALKSVYAEHVAKALVILFSRVGVAEEILTDQGTNFTLKLLTSTATREGPQNQPLDKLCSERYHILKRTGEMD